MKPQLWLAPLVPLYSAITRSKNYAYNSGILSQRRLNSPVISIGNLSTGGGGKTPLVIELARLLQSAGLTVDVLSRGYGRRGRATERVLISEESLSEITPAEQYGDEPLLIARAAQVPVFVGPSRFLSGTLAEQTAPSVDHIHLLDDGFQHRQLARDLDVIVLHRSDLMARLLPAGYLREPLFSLRRAHVIVVREEDSEADSEAVLALSKYLRPDTQIWRVRRTLTCKVSSGPAVAFCGIARPDEFFSGLRALGVDLAAMVAYSDHHRYTTADVARLLAHCRAAKAVSLITTEKDAIRLSPSALQTIAASIPLTVALLDTTFIETEPILETVRRVLVNRVL